MTAKEQFRVGQRVQLTARGRARVRQYEDMAHQPDVYGTVVGFARDFYPELVAVRREGRQTRQSYHMDCWEPVP